jgi:hypothetical protein
MTARSCGSVASARNSPVWVHIVLADFELKR